MRRVWWLRCGGCGSGVARVSNTSTYGAGCVGCLLHAGYGSVRMLTSVTHRRIHSTKQHLSETPQ
eukprot:235412-Prorocentrum_minimum.AAC.1